MLVSNDCYFVKKKYVARILNCSFVPLTSTRKAIAIAITIFTQYLFTPTFNAYR